MSPEKKNHDALDLSAPCELMQIGDRERLKIPNAILAAVGMPTGSIPRPPLTIELVEEGLVRVHVTADIENRLEEIRNDLVPKVRAGDKNAQEELEVFKDRYRPITMETDGRLCLTQPVEIFLEIEPGRQPPSYLVIRAKDAKIEILNIRIRNQQLRANRGTLDLE